MSVQRTIAQRPSNKFVALTTTVKCFTAAGVAAAFSAATLRDGSMYIFATRAALLSALTALPSSTGNSALVVGESLLDIGHTYWAGVAGDESRMVKLNVVQRNSTAAVDDGQGDLVYVVTAVNAATATTNTTLVGVARV